MANMRGKRKRISMLWDGEGFVLCLSEKEKDEKCGS